MTGESGRRPRPGAPRSRAVVAGIVALAGPALLGAAGPVADGPATPVTPVPCDSAALVAAVSAANAAGHGVLSLSPGCGYTLTAPSADEDGLPRITGALTIEGHGASIMRSADAGTPNFRIFEIAPTGSLALGQTTVENGSVPDGLGGGIHNDRGRLELTGVTLTRNASRFAGGGGVHNGGGIVSVKDSHITGNTLGGGFGNDSDGRARITSTVIDDNKGAGIVNVGIRGDISVDDSHISRNSGDGISVYGGTVTISRSLLDDNPSPFDGGAVYNALGTVTITGSRISDNTAAGRGGGVLSAHGRTTIIDTVITGNAAIPFEDHMAGGGGVAARGGHLRLVNVTITHNTATGNSAAPNAYGGGLHVADDAEVTIIGGSVTDNTATTDGGGIYDESGTVTLEGTRIDHNTPDNCAPPSSVPGCPR